MECEIQVVKVRQILIRNEMTVRWVYLQNSWLTWPEVTELGLKWLIQVLWPLLSKILDFDHNGPLLLLKYYIKLIGVYFIFRLWIALPVVWFLWPWRYRYSGPKWASCPTHNLKYWVHGTFTSVTSWRYGIKNPPSHTEVITWGLQVI